MTEDSTKNKTREFSIEFLQGVLGKDQDGAKIVANKIVDTSRWSIHHDLVLVFKYEDTFYATFYSVGATESQDEGPWQYADDPVTVAVVHPVEVTVIEYR